jgi:thiamine-phosphate diphosphorylase / hydroxyethylthiazole kinase
VPDGVAVVSGIAASKTPRKSALSLHQNVSTCRLSPSSISSSLQFTATTASVLKYTAYLLSLLREKTPLVHHITNQVVMNQSANITLAIGGSPLMAMAPEEMEDISKICSALLVNFGTVGDTEGMFKAGKLQSLSLLESRRRANRGE